MTQVRRKCTLSRVMEFFGAALGSTLGNKNVRPEVRSKDQAKGAEIDYTIYCP